MAEKKTNEILEEQRRARQEFLDLKKMQQGEMEAPPKPSEVAIVPKTPKEKWDNFWFQYKWYVIAITAITVVVAVLVAQCATRTAYDYEVVLFSYTSVLDEQADKIADYIEKYAEDMNGDGEVNVQILNCSFTDSASNTQYRYTMMTKLQSTIAGDQNAMLYITDEDAYEYLDQISDGESFLEDEPYKLGSDFYEATADDEWGELPEGLTISCRRVSGTTLDKSDEAKENYDAAQDILEKIKALDCDTIAGFIVEPIQGDMGMLPMHQRLMHEIYSLSRKHHCAFIADEVQMAFYRTGPFFSIENYPDVFPDAVTMGKHIGGGIPLGAILGRKEFMQVLGPCEHAFSMAGNSEACARGLYNFNLIESKDFQNNLHKNIEILQDELKQLKQKYPSVIEKYTGLGLAYGLWVKSINSHEDDNKACQKIIKRAFDLGLYTMRIGANWIRIEPMLNLDEKLLKEGMAILDKAIADYAGHKL